MNGMALPSWLLTPGTVFLHRHVRNKSDPFCDPVELVEGNPTYSDVVRIRYGRESTVSTSDLAPYPPAHNGNANPANTDSLPESDGLCGNDVEDVAADETDGVRSEKENDNSSVPEDIASDSEPALPRRSTRRRKPPDRCGFNYPLYTALLSGSLWIGNPINHSSTTVSVSPSCLSAHVFNHMRFSESN